MLKEEGYSQNDVQYVPFTGSHEMKNFCMPDHFFVILFEKCSGVHTLDFIEYEQTQNQICICYPKQIHSLKTELDARGHQLIVSKKFIDQHMFNSRLALTRINQHPIINIPEDYKKPLLREFTVIGQQLKAHATKKNTLYLRAQLALTMINNLIDRQMNSNSSNESHPVILKLADILEASFLNFKSVAFYADQLAVTPNYLSILTKRYIGTSAKEFINARVTLEAKRNLLGTKKTIKEIAYYLGFSSCSAFTAFVATQTGFPPKEYRSRYTQKMAENYQHIVLIQS